MMCCLSYVVKVYRPRDAALPMLCGRGDPGDVIRGTLPAEESFAPTCELWRVLVPAAVGLTRPKSLSQALTFQHPQNLTLGIPPTLTYLFLHPAPLCIWRLGEEVGRNL